MNKRLTDKLFASYPNLFTLIHDGSMNQPRSKYMPQSIQSFGIECMDGWYGIIRDVCDRLESLIVEQPQEKRAQYQCVQIKEKLGFLCVYLNDYTNGMRDTIKVATKLSMQTCEYCGCEGKIHIINNWKKCMCDGHKDFYILERKIADLQQRLRYFANLGSKIGEPHMVNLIEIWREEDDPDRPGQKRKVLVEKVTLDTYQLKKTYEEINDEGTP
jgi:hypothetical protein